MKKHRLMVLGVSLLASLGVLSSGFAGWVIAAGSKDAEGTGNIKADYEVETTGIKSVALTKGPEKDINFSGTQGDSKWFSSNNQAENLTASFVFTIETYTENATLSFTNLAFVETDSNKGYETANKNEVVGTLPKFMSGNPSTDTETTGYINIDGAQLSSSNANEASINITGKSLVVTFNIHFAWGKAFEGKNPVNYFNGLSSDRIDVQAAQDKLKKLEDANGATFQLSFTVGVTA